MDGGSIQRKKDEILSAFEAVDTGTHGDRPMGFIY
jgi:hypothetical protein